MTAVYEVLPSLVQDSPEWHEQRRRGVGASDVAAILGLSPWTTPLAVYEQKMGVPNQIDENLAWFGHALEPVIADWVAAKHPEVGPIFDGFSARSLQWPWLTAAPDRTSSWPGTLSPQGAELHPVEIKTSSAFSRGTWEAGVPLYYAAQVQAQMAVLGAPRGWLAVLHGGNDPELYPIERDEEFIQDELVPRTRAFWEDHVLAQVPPEPMTTGEAVRVWPGDPDLDAVEADDLLLEQWKALVDARRWAKTYGSDADRLALEIQKALGDATELRFGDQVLATWKPQAGARRLDTTQLKQDHPDLVAAYTRQGEPSRRFLPKEPKARKGEAA